MIDSHKHIADLHMRSNGVDVSMYDDSFLGKSIRKRMSETDFVSMEEYCAFLKQSNQEGTIFMESLRISYSEFFRNPLTFAVLEHIVLPGILLKKHSEKRKEIRIWSAACAGGEEAYSLAILFEELKKSAAATFTYRIIATDQSASQVHEAKQGRYAAAALNNLSMKRAGEWFVRQGDVYTVNPKLREHIDFSTFNLFDEELSCPPASIFGDFDLVFCANLLFYYKPEYRNRILGKTGNSLAADGFLVTGEVEREIVSHKYREVFPRSAIFSKLDTGWERV